MWKTFWDKLSGLLYPRTCVGCGASATHFCAPCLARAEPAEVSELENGIEAVFSYHDRAVRRAIWLLKYRGVKALAPIFAQIIYERLGEDLAEWRQLYPPRSSEGGEKLLLIPIPLSKERLRERGFNQAALIARALVALDPEHLEMKENILEKIKNPPPQVSLKRRRERLINLRGAFAIRDSVNTRSTSPADKYCLKSRLVILVDDVVTTGATVAEARRVLRAAGAAKVFAIAVAHG